MSARRAIRSGMVTCIWMGWCIAGWSTRISSAEDPTSDLGTVIRLEPADTLSTLALHHLGSADAAREILAFNQLDEAAFAALARSRAFIAIPGHTRTQALEARDNAETFLHAMEEARAETLAPQAYELAIQSLKQGHQLLEDCSYDKALAHFRSNQKHFEQAIRLAEQNALQLQPVKIIRVEGRAGLSGPDQREGALYADPEGEYGEQTDWVTGSEALLGLHVADAWEWTQAADSHSQLLMTRRDQRNNARRTVFHLSSGSAEIRTSDATGDRFEVFTPQGQVLLPPSGHALISAVDENRTMLVAYEGGLRMEGRDQSFTVEEGMGAFLQPEALIQEPLFDMRHLQLPDQETGQQRPTLYWTPPDSAPAHFMVEVGSSNPIGCPQQVQMSKEAQVRLDGIPFGEWFWRIRGVSKAGIPGYPTPVSKLVIQPRLAVRFLLQPAAVKLPDGTQAVAPGTRIKVKPRDSQSSVVNIQRMSPEGGGVEIPKPWSLDEPGLHELAICGFGSHGEKGPVQNLRVMVDGTPPTLQFRVETLAPETPGGGAGLQVTLSASDNLSGCRIEVANGPGASFEPYAGPLVFPPSERPQLRCRAVDAVGNLSRETTLPLDQF